MANLDFFLLQSSKRNTQEKENRHYVMFVQFAEFFNIFKFSCSNDSLIWNTELYVKNMNIVQESTQSTYNGLVYISKQIAKRMYSRTNVSNRRNK